jgi:hypothetical protein
MELIQRNYTRYTLPRLVDPPPRRMTVDEGSTEALTGAEAHLGSHPGSANRRGRVPWSVRLFGPVVPDRIKLRTGGCPPQRPATTTKVQVSALLVALVPPAVVMTMLTGPVAWAGDTAWSFVPFPLALSLFR